MATIQATIARISNSKKSAMVTVKGNKRQLGVVNAYVGLTEEEQQMVEKKKLKKGDTLTLDTGFKAVEKFDAETGERFEYENGEPVLFLEWV